MKEDGVLAESIPEGYEIYEDPNARVSLRKIRPKIITDEEVAIVENGVRDFAKLDNFKIDVKSNSIVVFLPDQDLDRLEGILSQLWLDSSKVHQALSEVLSYSPMMRFILIDEESRKFGVERYCFRGSMDDWIDLDESTDLARLVKKYGKHLGRDSFYDLI